MLASVWADLRLWNVLKAIVLSHKIGLVEKIVKDFSYNYNLEAHYKPLVWVCFVFFDGMLKTVPQKGNCLLLLKITKHFKKVMFFSFSLKSSTTARFQKHALSFSSNSTMLQQLFRIIFLSLPPTTINRLLFSSSSYSVVPGQAASASSRNLEMQILEPHPRPIWSGAPVCFNKPSRGF